jgi:hypothetical protein
MFDRRIALIRARWSGGALLALAGVLGLTGLASTATAAPGDHDWSLGFLTAGATVVSTGPMGEVTTGGTFFGSVDLGGGTLTSMGMFTPDVFFAQWDSSGAHQWSFRFTHNNGFGGVTVNAIGADASGNVYITGRIHDGDIDFGGGTLTGPNLYVLKLDSAGGHVWSATYGNGTPNGIAVSAAGVAIAGTTSASVDFGGGAIASAGANDAIVAVLSSGGAHVFSAGFGDAANDQAANDVTIDGSGNVVIAGGMLGTVDFGGGPLVAAAANLFLAAFGPTGTHAWSKVITGSFAGGASVFSVKPYLAGGASIAVAGEMRGTVDFGGGGLTSNGQADIYVAVYAGTTGAHQWSKHWGATTSEIVNDVSEDPAGNLAISGTMRGSFDAGGGALPYDAFSDLFVLSLDPSGAHRWSAGFGSAGSDFFASNASDGTGAVVLLGGAGSGIDFGGGPHSDASLFVARREGTAAVAVPALGPATAIGLMALLAGVGAWGTNRSPRA